MTTMHLFARDSEMNSHRDPPDAFDPAFATQAQMERCFDITLHRVAGKVDVTP